MDETKKTLSDTRNAVNGIPKKAEDLIHTANQNSVDVKGKMKAVDPLVESAHDVWNMFQSVTSSLKSAASQNRTPKTIHTQESKPFQIKLK